MKGTIIKTKYRIGQKVWVIDYWSHNGVFDYFVKSDTLTKTTIHIRENRTDFYYEISGLYDNEFENNKVFPTKKQAEKLCKELNKGVKKRKEVTEKNMRKKKKKINRSQESYIEHCLQNK